VRCDLSPSQVCVQATHAAIETARFLSPTLDHPHVIIAGAENEEKLQKCLKQIEFQGIICKPFFESDLNGELTAFATELISADKKQIFRKFQLLKASDFMCDFAHRKE